MKDRVQAIIKAYGKDRTRLMDMLIEIQDEYSCIPRNAIETLSNELEMSEAEVEQTLSFYHFFSYEPTGKYTVYLNNSMVAMMFGREAVARAFENETGISFGNVTYDGLIGLFDTADIGMNDQEPAALINGIPFTNLTVTKVKELVAGFRAGKKVKELLPGTGDGKNADALIGSMVRNNCQMHKGAILCLDYELGEGLKCAINRTPDAVIEAVKSSNIRGRGGAGFPAGLKWEFCKRSPGNPKYLVCNADEGEPGTFKDRVLLTEMPEQVFEGMAIAAYAVGIQEGFVYLRAEYKYLKNYLEDVLSKMREKKLLGKNILGVDDFNFDIRIQMGAGAYVCGEESALIESMEGKRGEPRNRPPFPVQSGYLNQPTIVNNVETLSAVVKIMLHGPDWFKALGTRESAGTKLLSVSGDCKKPGVYEVEYGTSISEILEMVEAHSVQAVQVAGPSGICIPPSMFKRKISFEDLPTGGAITIIGDDRNLLKDVVLNYMDFFIDESCSSCAPCRSLSVILKNKLEKLLKGVGTLRDIDELYDWCKYMKQANRCGLGQTAANPIISTIENFRHLYESQVATENDFISEFNMEKAVAASCKFVDRVPNLK
ncbi:MAG TPA: NAD(P)H-dependent oxidoreductase subunit E [Bacteroidales bacterium]|nr:NAD(P)H-dependent oxidoreductase subunit E [Bacteroidales bacterium]